MNMWKQVIGDELRAHSDERRATEVAVAVHVLNRMPDLGRSSYTLFRSEPENPWAR